VRELDHRARNLLAVVLSVVQLSRAETITDFTAAVAGRIKALSRAHSLLSESRWQSVDLARIVDEEIAPFSTNEARQVIAVGPDVSLQPSAAQSLALAIHELVTNAVKYGALSLSRGRVTLTWELEAEALMLRWVENDGPAAQPPSRRGFGTRVIAAGIESQLGGRADFDWRPEGLCCTLTIPRSTVESRARMNGQAAASEANETSTGAVGVAGRRILLIEDETLVGTMMQEVLEALGFTVIGPIGNLDQAIAAATKERIDGAILDINIAGKMVYPVADLLAARAIPFIFVTGYLPDGIDRRFAHVAVLEKPIDSQTVGQIFANLPGPAILPAVERSDAAPLQ
jgi:two-component sensor histidine kinase/CheY-like chemotaxis protein